MGEIGSLDNQDDDGKRTAKKRVGLEKQNNNFARAPRITLHVHQASLCTYITHHFARASRITLHVHHASLCTCITHHFARAPRITLHVHHASLCTCITLFCTFLCCYCTTTTLNCLISPQMEHARSLAGTGLCSPLEMESLLATVLARLVPQNQKPMKSVLAFCIIWLLMFAN